MVGSGGCVVSLCCWLSLDAAEAVFWLLPHDQGTQRAELQPVTVMRLEISKVVEVTSKAHCCIGHGGQEEGGYCVAYSRTHCKISPSLAIVSGKGKRTRFAPGAGSGTCKYLKTSSRTCCHAIYHGHYDSYRIEKMSVISGRVAVGYSSPLVASSLLPQPRQSGKHHPREAVASQYPWSAQIQTSSDS